MKLTDTPAGYSGKPLIVKLGIKTGFTICVINPPENYYEILGEMPAAINVKTKLSGNNDFIHFFTDNEKEYSSPLPSMKKHLAKSGMVWISWPKKSSKVATNLDENVIRNFALKNGLVDIKVCAVDEVWSGLKLVIPVKERAGRS